MSTYWVKRMDQAALLVDTFKMSILEQFVEEPRTAKQVAEILNTKQTRLYRHIDALVQADLLKVVKEQQKRGTVERFYQTVATRFELDGSLLSNKDNENDTTGLVRNMLRDTEKEVLSLLENVDFSEDMPDEDTPLMMRISARGSKERMQSLRQKLEEWLAEFHPDQSEEYPDDAEELSFRGLIMFYPVPQKEE